MTIRPAVLADVPALVALGCRFLASSVYGGYFRENLQQIDQTATHLITHEDGIVLVALEADSLRGAIGVLCFPHTWSGARTAGELFWYVDPEARGSIGIRLFKAAEVWAVSQSATSLQMVAPEGAERIEQLYQRSGYAPLERGWVRTL